MSRTANFSDGAAHRERANQVRELGRRRAGADHQESYAPAAGAHAAKHLTNEDATPGAGTLTGQTHSSGKDVDGAAG